MTFLEALLQLEQGKRIKQKEWQKGCYFYKGEDGYRERKDYTFSSLDLHLLITIDELIDYCKEEWEVVEND